MRDKMSKSVDKFYTDNKTHFITVASWNSEWGLSYEVGLRDLKTNDFKLIASYLDSEEKARAIGKATKILMNNGMTMDELDLIFPGLFK